MDLISFESICLVGVLCFVLSSLFCVLLIIGTRPLPDIEVYEQENFFLDTSVEPLVKNSFPSIHDKPTIDLSVIVPAYNEEERLPKMLNECIEFLEERRKNMPDYMYEILVVDDGSSDQTSSVAQRFCKNLGHGKLRVLTLQKNRGKGGAVRMGMLRTRGRYLLFADADGATKFSDIVKLEEKLNTLSEQYEDVVVIGSRAHLEEQAIATRSLFRTFLMYGFHFLVWLFGVRGIRDTQCGFKLFTRSAAISLFMSIHVERWAFDVELLYLARRLHMLVEEVAVNWTEIEGSKLVPFWSWIQMAKDLAMIWLKYRTGAWKIACVQAKT